jgi:hypothetical protein
MYDNENMEVTQDVNTEMMQDEAENTAAPANESKADKFLRLAPPRVTKVMQGIQSLKKLSARSSYEYSEEQTQKMFAAIRAELDECEAAFKPKEEKKSEGFSF